jgi:uncharacterized protein YceH (UPF0502 family)
MNSKTGMILNPKGENLQSALGSLEDRVGILESLLAELGEKLNPILVVPAGGEPPAQTTPPQNEISDLRNKVIRLRERIEDLSSRTTDLRDRTEL